MIDRRVSIRFNSDYCNIGRKRASSLRSMTAEQATSLLCIALFPSAPLTCGQADSIPRGMAAKRPYPRHRCLVIPSHMRSDAGQEFLRWMVPRNTRSGPSQGGTHKPRLASHLRELR
jgi:hypothetical protein